MTIEILTHVFGYAATICMLAGYLPQAWHTLRTRDTEGIATPTFLMMGAGSSFFVVQGALTGNIPLVITNSITTICSAIVFIIKLHNDSKKKAKH